MIFQISQAKYLPKSSPCKEAFRITDSGKWFIKIDSLKKLEKLYTEVNNPLIISFNPDQIEIYNSYIE